ncbi:MAG: pilus assembly protein [Rhizobiales bacterium]|nr:pilus assembly protein [Hyphomicrobiales bacterium]
MTNSLRKFIRAENGVAAIETAIIMPFLLMLFFGMIDLTAMISFNRKITYSASVIADLVAQNRTNVLKSQIDDYYNAAAMIIAPTPSTQIHVDVYGYRKVGTTVTQIWKTKMPTGPMCSTTPDTAAIGTLMTASNDVIVAISCMDYTPYIGTFLGKELLGGTSFNVEQAIMVRPRSTSQLTCYQTAVGGTLCS